MYKIKRKGLISLLLGVVLISAMLIPAVPVFADTVSMYVSPATQTVDPGESFIVQIYINSDVVNRCAQADVQFDPTLIHVNSVTEGTYYSSWASSHGGGTQYQAPTINNTTGLINDAAVVVTGAAGQGVTGSGVFIVINATALAAVNGTSAITLPETYIGDVNISPLAHTTTNGAVTVGQPAGPDLVVSALSTEWIDEEAGTYNVVYTITNQGSASAGASTTVVEVDEDEESYACSALAAGASEEKTVGPFTIDDGEDLIVVIVDDTGVVTEGNESNNVKEYTLSPSTMIVEGNTVGTIIISIPDSILDWVLEIGDNSQTGTLNVKCNTDWQVTVSDDNSTTGGHMTEWDGSTYGTKFLVNAMEVVCAAQSKTVGLDSSGVIATGTPSGQSNDDGEDVSLGFNQSIKYTDAVLSSGSVYRVVITFTGSMTF